MSAGLRMDAEVRSIRSLVPSVVTDVTQLLERMERPDLASQLESLHIVDEQRSPRDRRRSFFAGEGVRGYSIEMDTRDAVVILDISASHTIIAMHVLRGLD